MRKKKIKILGVDLANGVDIESKQIVFCGGRNSGRTYFLHQEEALRKMLGLDKNLQIHLPKDAGKKFKEEMEKFKLSRKK